MNMLDDNKREFHDFVYPKMAERAVSSFYFNMFGTYIF